MKIYQYRLDFEDLPRPIKSNCNDSNYDLVIGNVPIKFPFTDCNGITYSSIDEVFWIEITPA